MGDIAQILGVPSRDAPPKVAMPRAVQMQQLPKEVLEVMGGSDLPTAVPARHVVALQPNGTTKKENASDTVVKVGNKWISSSKPARPWIWAPFASSARNDGLQLHHWVRNHVEYPDYPYARFNIHLDEVVYTDENEYRTLLHVPDWSKSETDQLLELAKRYELRWPVIYDRWMELFGLEAGASPEKPPHRKIEDLQYRYYTVAAIVLQQRIAREANAEAQALAARSTDDRPMDTLLVETAAARALATTDPQYQPLFQNIGTGASNKVVFDLQQERQRRQQMEALWHRTKEEELEAAELRKELKQIEAQLRKMKKSGAHVMASRSPSSRAPTPIPVGSDVEHAFATTVAVAGTPYLQSGRLLPPATGSGINKALKSRMDDVLEELGVSKQPLPTKRVCDLYDAVRKDVLTLLIVQKEVLLREGQLSSKRLRLSKKSGQSVFDEESLLGIHPPPMPAGVSTGNAANNKGARKVAKPENPKSKKKASPKTASTVVAPSSSVDAKVLPATKPEVPVTAPKPSRKPSGTKRKRKADEIGSTGATSDPTTVMSEAPSAVGISAPVVEGMGAASQVKESEVPSAVPSTDPKLPGKKRPAKKTSSTTSS